MKVPIDFDENYKKISECNHGIVHKRGPKTPTKVTKKGFWRKLQKIMEWNDMRDGKVLVLQQKRQKERFWWKLQKMVECNDMKDNREQVLQQKDENDENNDLGENLLSWMTGSR